MGPFCCPCLNIVVENLLLRVTSNGPIYFNASVNSNVLIFYILLTVHLGTILANNQLDALPLMYLFILPLYLFRTAQCSSSGDRLY